MNIFNQSREDSPQNSSPQEKSKNIFTDKSPFKNILVSANKQNNPKKNDFQGLPVFTPKKENEDISKYSETPYSIV